jgi:arylsulfatase A-like enzyme
VFTAWACDYLTERAAEAKPFFLYLAYNAPHDPVQPPEDWLAQVKARQPGITEKRARLVALIEHLDSGIGRVLDTLDRLKLSDNTVVLFNSDNGGLLQSGANNGPWRSGKTHMYEGGLRVPALVRWPGHIAAGSRTERRTATMDLFPTCCELAGVPVPKGIDGRSFRGALSGEPETSGAADDARDFYFVRREGGVLYGGKTIEALIHGDWKLVLDSPFAPMELYNLRADPAEASDVAKREPKMVGELSGRLRRQVQRGGSVPWQRAELP